MKIPSELHILVFRKRFTAESVLSVLLSAVLALCLTGCQKPSVPAEETLKTLTILATSDTHGKLWPWNYSEDCYDTSGSFAQLKTAISQLYNPDTCLLVDAGDTIQGTHAYLFLEEKPNPMVQALNDLGYEVETTGNHEYNCGMDITKRVISEFQGHEIIGNVLDETGKPLGEPWAIIEKKRPSHRGDLHGNTEHHNVGFRESCGVHSAQSDQRNRKDPFRNRRPV